MAKNTTKNITPTPHFFDGNIKVGDMLTWNKLAGNGYINGCKGSCGEYCKGCYNPDDPYGSPCYVFKSYRQYKDDVINPHIVNTRAIRTHLRETMEHLDGILSRKRKVKPIRIHASGEIESTEELMEWMRLSKKHEVWPFYIYTKAEDYVDEALTKMAKEGYPTNFFINISIWHENGIALYNKWKHLPFVRAYAYDDGYDYEAHGLKLDGYCPAYRKETKTLKSGKTVTKVVLKHDLTCDKCKLCFGEKAKVLGCLSH